MRTQQIRALVRERGAIGIYQWYYFDIKVATESPGHDVAVQAFIEQYGDKYEFNAILLPGDKHYL